MNHSMASTGKENIGVGSHTPTTVTLVAIAVRLAQQTIATPIVLWRMAAAASRVFS